MAIGDVKQQFDYQRQKAAQASNADLQMKRDALARRAAQSGGGPSGAFIKAEQNAIDQNQRNLADVHQGIGAQESAEMARLREIDDARKFQSAERLATQQFAAGEREAQQGFARGEREASQTFQQGQFDANKAIQEAALTGRYGGRQTIQAKAAADAQNMARQEFEQNVRTNAINTVISMYNSKIKPEAMGQFLDELNITFDPKTGEPSITLPEVKGLTAARPEKPKYTPQVQPSAQPPRPWNSGSRGGNNTGK